MSNLLGDGINEEAEASKQEARNIEYLEAAIKDGGEWFNEPDPAEAPVIKNLFEEGEICALVGQTKSRKSFLALQMAVCIAMEKPFLNYETKEHKTLICNLEVSERSYKKRYKKICERLNIPPENIAGKLSILNLKRGRTNWDDVLAFCKKHECKVCIIDPFYKIARIKENDQDACLETEAKMEQFSINNITLITVFHATKGFNGERQVVDMISGSGIISRFQDSIIGFSHHAHEKNAIVLDASIRSYEDPDPFSTIFNDGIFERADDLSPTPATARSYARKMVQAHREATKATGDEICKAILAVSDNNEKDPNYKGKGMKTGDFGRAVRVYIEDTFKKKSPDERKFTPYIENLINEGKLETCEPKGKGIKNNTKYIGKKGCLTWETKDKAK